MNIQSVHECFKNIRKSFFTAKSGTNSYKLDNLLRWLVIQPQISSDETEDRAMIRTKYHQKGAKLNISTKNNKSSEICLFLQGSFVTWCQVLRQELAMGVHRKLWTNEKDKYNDFKTVLS